LFRVSDKNISQHPFLLISQTFPQKREEQLSLSLSRTRKNQPARRETTARVNKTPPSLPHITAARKHSRVELNRGEKEELFFSLSPEEE
jgi:hypothetical protein